MDIILLFLAKPLDKHGITLVHITYTPLAKQSKAKQSKAKQSKAKQSKAKQSKAKQSKALLEKINSQDLYLKHYWRKLIHKIYIPPPYVVNKIT